MADTTFVDQITVIEADWANDVNDYVYRESLSVAKKDYIINGDFDIWQRGTSFSTGGDEYTADRFFMKKWTQVFMILHE